MKYSCVLLLLTISAFTTPAISGLGAAKCVARDGATITVEHQTGGGGGIAVIQSWSKNGDRFARFVAGQIAAPGSKVTYTEDWAVKQSDGSWSTYNVLVVGDAEPESMIRAIMGMSREEFWQCAKEQR